MTTETTRDRLLTVADLADRLQVATRTIRRMRAAGRLPKPIYVAGSQSPRWTEDQINRWLANRAKSRSRDRSRKSHRRL